MSPEPGAVKGTLSVLIRAVSYIKKLIPQRQRTDNFIILYNLVFQLLMTILKILSVIFAGGQS